MEEWITIGNKIREAREQKELIQKEMASFLDVSLSTYSAYERGKKAINFLKLKKICKILGVSINSL